MQPNFKAGPGLLIPVARFRWLKRFLLSAFVAASIANVCSWAAGGAGRTDKPGGGAALLGARLFKDARFATAKGDLPASCSHCHLLNEDPQGTRAHTDFLARSWVSYRLGDPRRDELRNSPTLFDVSKMPRLHFDGEFETLEQLVKGTLSGRPMGWLPDERQEAFEQIRRTVLADLGDPKRARSSYREQFKLAYGITLDGLSRDEVVQWVARAISDYVRTLNSERTTPYDAFIALNGLEKEPANDTRIELFAGRLLTRISTLERDGKLKLPKGFDSTALAGMKIFLSTEGSGPVGNCVICHAPPLFTDFSFHNMGISQLEYDKLHGEGSFAQLKIPGAEAVRPSHQFRETPSKRKPGEVDLGYWNFADLKSSPLRRPAESDDQFLRRMLATFKTPTLRHLRFTPPYMHNGAFGSLEDALAELIELSDMARAGRIREGDDELAKIRIGPDDLPSLMAFLNALNQDLTPKRRTTE